MKTPIEEMCLSQIKLYREKISRLENLRGHVLHTGNEGVVVIYQLLIEAYAGMIESLSAIYDRRVKGKMYENFSTN